LKNRFHERQVSFLVVKTVKCKCGINYMLHLPHKNEASPNSVKILINWGLRIWTNRTSTTK